MRSATIVDVAKKAGVSVTTVSRFLNKTGPVGSVTKKKIQAAMTELNYVPNMIARSMKAKQSKTIAVFIPDVGNSFYSEILAGLVPIAESFGYIIITCMTNDEAKYEINNIQQVLSRNIDGIIFFTYAGVRNDLDYIHRLSKKVPIVFMDPVFEHEFVSVVTTDGFLGTKEAVKYLAELGHRRIGYIKSPSEYLVTQRRYEGYLAALALYNIPFDESLVYEVPLINLLTRGFEAGQYFLSLSQRPTAVVTLNDEVAIGLMNYLKVHEIDIPGEIAVIGYDNIPLSRLVTPPLTTVAQPIRQLGEEALKLLIQKIEIPGSINRKIFLDTNLIIRHSTDASKPLVCKNEFS